MAARRASDADGVKYRDERLGDDEVQWAGAVGRRVERSKEVRGERAEQGGVLLTARDARKTTGLDFEAAAGGGIRSRWRSARRLVPTLRA
jgi:hypothetical protein